MIKFGKLRVIGSILKHIWRRTISFQKPRLSSQERVLQERSHKRRTVTRGAARPLIKQGGEKID